ncbi:ABC transporter ATP-binding protein [Roseiarcaceae bacterium H3SJ34-1]|uniref:ABC transporter ATP-binding protein n=1 Tax=Terripilifer ovatus TaxID=3032367 RepID=UPI003AB93EF3|nr:ABC transporter ATP-binding protein [Roseiarcaceae bacterium H3SJ34-1]
MDNVRALDVRNVSAGYGGRPIVADIDFCVRAGDILGLLGANGSGKTTLLKALTGQLPLMTGTVAIAGIDLTGKPEKAKAAFGLAIEPGDLPASLSGQQYLELVASIRGCTADAWPCGDVMARLGLARWLPRPIAGYSLGTRAKTAIAAALLGAPPLLIFDESLNGLDPEAAWEVKCMIAELAQTEAHAIVISTHVVETVPALCNRAMFLAEGRILESWDAAALAQAAPTPGAFEAHIIRSLRDQKASSRRRALSSAAPA